MNNNHESMPNQAPEPKKPDFSEDDIGSLIESFKEGRSEEERAESSASIESMIAETIKELDEQEAQREAEKAAKEKNERVERTGIVYGEASKVAAETLKDSLSMALQMADTPEGAVLLVNPVHERRRRSSIRTAASTSCTTTRASRSSTASSPTRSATRRSWP